MTVTSVGPGLVTPMEFTHEIHRHDAYREGSAQRLKVQEQKIEGAIQNKTPPLHETERGQFKPQIIHSTAADLERIGLVFDKKLQFVVDHGSNEVTVKVIDRETDKVIKELPPEELQRLHNDLKETIGFLFDERV
jgi:flagellar protein FlaG